MARVLCAVRRDGGGAVGAEDAAGPVLLAAWRAWGGTDVSPGLWTVILGPPFGVT